MPSVPFCNLEDVGTSDWEKKQNSKLTQSIHTLPTFKNANSCMQRNNRFQDSIAKTQFQLDKNPLNNETVPKPIQKPVQEPIQKHVQEYVQKPVQKPSIPSAPTPSNTPETIQYARNNSINHQMNYQQYQQQPQYQYMPISPMYVCPNRIPQHYDVYSAYPTNLRLPSRWFGSFSSNNLVENFGNGNSYKPSSNEIIRNIIISILVIYGIYLLIDISG